MNLKISQRLYLAVGMALVLPALVLVATFVLDAQGRAQFDSALAKAKERREVAGAMRDTVFRQGLQARNIGLRSDVDEMKKEVDGLRALKDVYKKNLARFCGPGQSGQVGAGHGGALAKGRGVRQQFPP